MIYPNDCCFTGKKNKTFKPLRVLMACEQQAALVNEVLSSGNIIYIYLVIINVSRLFTTAVKPLIRP